MKESRSESEHGGNLLSAHHAFSDLLELRFILRKHGYVSQQRQVVAALNTVEVRPNNTAKRLRAALHQSFRIRRVCEEFDSVLFQNRLFRWKRTRFFESAGQLSR